MRTLFWKTFFLASFLFSASAYAQVGIGIGTSATPKATLEVGSKPTATNVPDGLIAPILKLSELHAKVAAGAYNKISPGIPVAALVYISAIDITPTESGTTGINAIGYYYFDGSTWNKIRDTKSDLDGAATNGITMTTISNRETYKLGGHLSEKTTLDGTDSLIVNAPFKVSGANGSFTLANGSQGAGKFLVSDANGKATWKNEWFYMPPTAIDITSGTRTVNLFTRYSASISGASGSGSALSNFINVGAAGDYYYYIAGYDATLFTAISVNAAGDLTYTSSGDATDQSYLTVIFVRK
ncbi:MAG: hypothetical protein LBR64_07415 [Dysgonamonadaceae bacterium]|jgi:hypothetical protein|nr:hypothetical protein [Dysgonamonadaceae bacterium]